MTRTKGLRYCGFAYPAEHHGRVTHVVCRIHALRVTVDAIHH